MELKEDSERSNTSRRLSYLFGVFMLFIYWGMAYLLLFSPVFNRQMSPGIRYTMGAVFFIYGCWRGWRMTKYKK